MNYRKGLVYVVEGIFASLILGAYLFQIIGISPTLQIIEKKIIERQALYSYLYSINNLTAKYEVGNNNMFPAFYSLSSFILGKESRYDLGFSGESKYDLFLGVYIPPERSIKTQYITDLSHDECVSKLIGNVEDFENSITIKECKEGVLSNKEHSFLMVIPQNPDITNTLFIDFNDDGKYAVGGVGEEKEGAFLYDDLFERENKIYYIGDLPITNNTYFIYLLTPEEKYIKKYMEEDKKINSQDIRFFVYFFTLTQPFSQYDALLSLHEIPQEIMNDVLSFYYSGKDVVLISPTEFYSQYSSLFNINPISGTKYEYSIQGAEVEKPEYMESREIQDYLIHITTMTNPFTLHLSSPLPAEYTSDDIGDKKYTKYYLLNTTRGNTTIITYPSSLPNTYNMYIDYDNDKNFDEIPDNQSINLTEDKYSYFTWNGVNYKLLYISPNGEGVKLGVVDGPSLLYEPLASQYFPNLSSSTWHINFEKSEVCLNCTINVGEVITTPLTKISDNTWEGTLSLKKGVWEYTFYVVNFSSSYYLYFTSNYNKKYYNNSYVVLYPEKYKVTLYPSQSKVLWTLVARVPLPYISDKINELHGDAVFIPHLHILYYKDEAKFLFNLLYTITSNNLYWVKRAKKIGDESGNVVVMWNLNRKYPQIINIFMNKHLT